MSSKGSLRRYARLRLKKYRERERLFLAEGETLLREATVPYVAFFERPEELRAISTLSTPAGPAAVFPFLDVDAGELLEVGGPIVVLCGVQDPGNVGTVVRSAQAFGGSVALSRGCADLYNPKTVRATMGSLFHVPVARDVDPVEFLRLASECGYRSAAAVVEGGVPPRRMPGGKVLLVVGNEGAGLPVEVVRACELRLTIPSRAPSLNAAVAASILLYEAAARVLP
ncbi:TrmH family RNA methyltransferase [Rubrobacter calidifluminis]|uniref:TrmH family RNA methyltransferase n=1 Tax=Rubrobacter calidifluminis TaxID=1392640 RepID=UPI00235EC2FD|nr:RNA methyltransferase [Rubrobacter calidifluminis]